MRILKLFLLYRINVRDIEPVIELPVYGHLCKHIHKGYKVFNMRSGIVTKLFDSDVSQDSVDDEFKRLQGISGISFAPSLVKRNVNERWYEEEYISGSHLPCYKSLDSNVLLRSFNSEITPCLKGLMLYKQPESVKYPDYVNRLSTVLQVSESSGISDFVFLMAERLRGEMSSHIYLFFSHGDFCPANILATQHGIKILDWESVEYRSALFDFYSYFFYRPVCIDLPVDKMAVELKQAFPMFLSELAPDSSGISEHLVSFENIYRWVYYIERISMLLERELTDKNLNIMDFIRRYIDAFNRYEEMLADNPELRLGNSLIKLQGVAQLI